MTIAISPTDSEILAALRTFLTGVLGANVPVVEGQDNRVSEPSAGDYVVMWPIMRPRLATNLDQFVDTAFTGSIADDEMTVTEVAYGAIAVGAQVFGVDVESNTLVVAQTSGPAGGAGTYTVSVEQDLGSRTLSSGQLSVQTEVEVVVQLDFHSADLATAGNKAQTVATLFRDAYACDVIGAANAAVSPLFAEDPRQSPFISGEQQYETRWTVDVHLQANQTVSGIPQQFAAAAVVEVVSVDAEYPA